MKARVIATEESIIYNDGIYCCGDEFEVDEAIGKSLIERGLIADVDEAIAENPDKILDAVEMRDDIEKMTYPKLKSYASELGLSANGTKDELIARIREYFDSLEEAEETEELPDTSMPE